MEFLGFGNRCLICEELFLVDPKSVSIFGIIMITAGIVSLCFVTCCIGERIARMEVKGSPYSANKGKATSRAKNPLAMASSEDQQGLLSGDRLGARNQTRIADEDSIDSDPPPPKNWKFWAKSH